MANYENPSRYRTAVPTAAGALDEGLRAHMLRVYNYMGIGLAITGVVAYLTFPAIDRPHSGHDVDARGEVLVDEGAGELRGLLHRRCGGEDDQVPLGRLAGTVTFAVHGA